MYLIDICIFLCKGSIFPEINPEICKKYLEKLRKKEGNFRKKPYLCSMVSDNKDLEDRIRSLEIESYIVWTIIGILFGMLLTHILR